MRSVWLVLAILPLMGDEIVSQREAGMFHECCDLMGKWQIDSQAASVVNHLDHSEFHDHDGRSVTPWPRHGQNHDVTNVITGEQWLNYQADY